MSQSEDKYFKLKSPPPTPLEEICSCPNSPPIKLMCALGDNPIHCMNCNLVVDPASLDLPIDLVDGIAFWRSKYDAIDRLWLASDEYEEWARTQLSDISNPLNQSGRELRARLNPIRCCYYWYFQDQTTDDF